MSARDEALVSEGRKLHDAWFDGPDMEPLDRMVRMAKVARDLHQPRIITTAEELDALPELTVIRAVNENTKHFGTVFEKYGTDRPRWLALDPSDRNDGEETVESGHVLRWFGSHSVTVLYSPEATQ